MPAIKTVGIISKPKSPAAAAIVPTLIRWLRARSIAVRCDELTASYAPGETVIPRNDVPEGCDLIVVLGGDGTLLSAARSIGRREVPLFPVNLGGLGFLTAIAVDEIYPELERAFRGEQRIASRKLLHARVVRWGRTVVEYDALNDAVLAKAALARMIDLDVFSLSAGGPIIFPAVPTICLTPICPHTLTNRPVLVPETMTIRVISRNADETVYLTIDGQVGTLLKDGDAIVCRSTDFALRLVRPPHAMFFDVLRQKLKWGER